ncbi:MAG TPA: isochorismatase family protein [Nitrococcus sp.]|nr:isochorismatase family protein [Nitrococcus sp.]
MTLIDPAHSFLLVVDVQEKLIPAIHEHDELIASLVRLLGIATELGVPVRASEQYPRGLGRMIEPLRRYVPATAIAEKIHFSCARAPACRSLFAQLEQVPQVIIAGVEAHVCVLQSAIGLQQEGRDVFVVADAVGSRKPRDRQLALERLRSCGVSIVSCEMVAFEWLARADTPEFKRISRQYLR